MFGVLDLMTVSILQQRFEYYAKNVELLEFILCGYNKQYLFNFVGADYIKSAIEFIQSQRITIQPFYQLDSKKLPMVSVIAHGDENQQFIGEYGTHQIAPNKRQTVRSNPIVISRWTAVSINGDQMSTPESLNLQDKLWPGVYITNGVIRAKLIGVNCDGVLCLDTELPANTDPRDWRAETAGSDKVYEISSSIDKATVQCKLTTHGDPSQHRLLGTVLRACIKSSRLIFDQYGFQNISLSWTPMVLTDQDRLEFESVYQISGDYTDYWISKIAQTADKSANIGVDIIATHSDNTDEDVNL